MYPAFPQILYYSPELMKLQLIPHLEYAMNFTNQVAAQPQSDLPCTCVLLCCGMWGEMCQAVAPCAASVVVPRS